MSSGGFGADLGVLPARYIPRALAARSPRSPCPAVTLLSPLKDLQHRQPSEWEVIIGGAPGRGLHAPPLVQAILCLNMINEVALCNRGKPLYTLIKMDFGFTSKKRKNLKPLKWSVRQDNENLFQEVPRRLEWEARRWLPLYPPSPQDGVHVDLSPVPPAPRRLGRAVSPGPATALEEAQGQGPRQSRAGLRERGAG